MSGGHVTVTLRADTWEFSRALNDLICHGIRYGRPWQEHVRDRRVL